jgi:hypothetical protein
MNLLEDIRHGTIVRFSDFPDDGLSPLSEPTALSKD